MINKKILVAASCAVALLVGCKSGGDDSTGNKLPYGPATSNITITKANLPADAKICADEDTFDSVYMDYDNFTAQTVAITNDGYISVSLGSSATGKKEDCILKPFTISSKLNSIYLDHCSQSGQSDEGQFVIPSDNDNKKMIFVGNCSNDDDGYDIYKNGDSYLDLNTIPELVNGVTFSSDLNFAQLDIKEDQDTLYHVYDLNHKTMSPAFKNLDTGELMKSYTEEGNLALSDSGIGLVHTSDTQEEYVCYASSNSCSKLGISHKDTSNYAMSNDGTFLVYDNYNNPITKSLELINLKNKQVEHILTGLPLYATPLNATNEGAIIISYQNNNNDGYTTIYSYKNKKNVDLIDIIKAVGLNKVLSSDNKFYGGIQLSPNGKFLVVFSGKDKDWNNGDSYKLKEIDRVYLPNGIDGLLNTLPEFDNNKYAHLIKDDCKVQDNILDCQLEFSGNVDFTANKKKDGSYSYSLYDKTADSRISSSGGLQPVEDIKITDSAKFNIKMEIDYTSFAKAHEYYINSDELLVVQDHNNRMIEPIYLHIAANQNTAK